MDAGQVVVTDGEPKRSNREARQSYGDGLEEARAQLTGKSFSRGGIESGSSQPRRNPQSPSSPFGGLRAPQLATSSTMSADSSRGSPRPKTPVGLYDQSRLAGPRSLPYLRSTRARQKLPLFPAADTSAASGSRAATASGLGSSQPFGTLGAAKFSYASAGRPPATAPIAARRPSNPHLSAAEAARTAAEWREMVQERRQVLDASHAASDEMRRVRESTNRAMHAFSSREYRRAAEHLSESIKLCPNSDMLRRMRARAYARAGELPAALDDGRAAAALNPSSAENHRLLSSLALREGSLADAGKALCESMQRDASGQKGEVRYRALISTVGMSRHYWRPQPQRVVPRIFDKRVELSDPSRDKVAFTQLRVPERPPPLILDKLLFNTIKLSWEMPEDDGGDEIFEFDVECSYYDVCWSDELQGLFEGMHPFASWLKAPAAAAARTKEWTDLTADNVYCFRVRCSNSIGESEFSDVLTLRTPAPQPRDATTDTCPPAWLASDYADVLKEHVDARGVDGDDVLAEIAPILDVHSGELHVAFKLFCVITSKEATDVTKMQRAQFTRVIKDAAVMDDAGVLTASQVELIFQRANMDFRGGQGKEKGSNEDGGVEAMVESEFINALVRIAHLRFAGLNGTTPAFETLGERLSHLIENHILPSFRKSMPPASLLEIVKSRRITAILRKHGKALRQIFAAYAAADISSADARDADDSVNMKELLFMAKEGGLLDKEMPVAKLAYIFTAVNLENTLKSAEELTAEGIPTGEDGDGDDDDADDNEDELCYAEWCDVIVRIIREKSPADVLESKEFCVVLDEYLDQKLIPKYVQIIKDKKRGIGSKHV